MAETTVRKVKAPVSMLTTCPVCRETKTFRLIGFVERNSLFCCPDCRIVIAVHEGEVYRPGEDVSGER